MLVRSFESAANGMLALMDMNDNTANNLANVNTIGYKKGNLRFKDVMQSAVYSQEGSILRNDTSRYLGNISCGSQSMQYTHDFSQGALTKTSNPYDVAIEGDGFFKIQDADGNISYTRNGSFLVDRGYWLKTKQGEFVLDVNNRRIRMLPEDMEDEGFRRRGRRGSRHAGALRRRESGGAFRRAKPPVRTRARRGGHDRRRA